jgi:hypothetical protein
VRTAKRHNQGSDFMEGFEGYEFVECADDD